MGLQELTAIGQDLLPPPARQAQLHHPPIPLVHGQLVLGTHGHRQQQGTGGQLAVQVADELPRLAVGPLEVPQRDDGRSRHRDTREQRGQGAEQVRDTLIAREVLQGRVLEGSSQQRRQQVYLQRAQPVTLPQGLQLLAQGGRGLVAVQPGQLTQHVGHRQHRLLATVVPTPPEEEREPQLGGAVLDLVEEPRLAGAGLREGREHHGFSDTHPIQGGLQLVDLVPPGDPPPPLGLRSHGLGLRPQPVHGDRVATSLDPQGRQGLETRRVRRVGDHTIADQYVVRFRCLGQSGRQLQRVAQRHEAAEPPPLAAGGEGAAVDPHAQMDPHSTRQRAIRAESRQGRGALQTELPVVLSRSSQAPEHQEAVVVETIEGALVATDDTHEALEEAVVVTEQVLLVQPLGQLVHPHHVGGQDVHLAPLALRQPVPRRPREGLQGSAVVASQAAGHLGQGQRTRVQRVLVPAHRLAGVAAGQAAEGRA